MQMKLCGLQDVNFINDKGEAVKGTNLFTLFKSEKVIGTCAKKFFVNSSITLPELKPNDNLDIDFDYNGKILGVTVKG